MANKLVSLLRLKHDWVHIILVRFPNPLGKWVGRTNPLRAGNFTSEASSAENVACTPPHIIHNWILQHVRKAWTLSKLGQVTLGRGWSWFSCTPYLSTHAHPVYPLDFCQFTTWICSQESFHISHNTISYFSRQYCCIKHTFLLNTAQWTDETTFTSVDGTTGIVDVYQFNTWICGQE